LSGDCFAMAEGSSKVIKIMVLGDPGVGKTSIIKRYVFNVFPEHHKTTIGVDFATAYVQAKNGERVQIQLWDIAGQERFGSISRVYYKDSFGVLLVYDITKPKTFETVERWKSEIDSKISLPNGEPLPVLLLGNKKDKDVGDVDDSAMDDYVNDMGMIGWCDVSAYDGTNLKRSDRGAGGGEEEDAILVLVNNILEHEGIFEKQDKDRGTFIPGLTKGMEGGCCSSG